MVCAGKPPAFDTDLVGADGAGYRWVMEDVDYRQYSIAAPTMEGILDDDDGSNSEGSTTTVAELVC